MAVLDVESSINIEGVRLSLVGSGRDNITASVSGTGDIRLLGGANTVTVMNSIVDELDDDGVDVATTLTLIRHTGGPEKADEVQVVDRGEHGAFLRWRADQSGVLRNSRRRRGSRLTRGRPQQKTWRVRAKMVRILRWIKTLELRC